jgi:hypothetical protein
MTDYDFLNLKLDTAEGAKIFASWARGNGAVLNQAHKEMFIRHGVNYDGIVFNEPIPMDLSKAEYQAVMYYSGARKFGKTRAMNPDISIYNDNVSPTAPYPEFDAVPEERWYDDDMYYRPRPKRSPVAKANAKERNRKAAKAARKARRHGKS